MKLAVVWSGTPFECGEPERLGAALCSELRARDLEAEPVRLMFDPRSPQRVLDQMLAARLTRLSATDRVVGLSFPGYHVRHDDKVVWLTGQFGDAYELWGTERGRLPQTSAGEAARAAVIHADSRLLGEAHRIYAVSEDRRRHLLRFNGLEAELLAPPSPASSSGSWDHVIEQLTR
jgi:hypothetical protein